MPSSAISAKVPPSPPLSARITNVRYFTTITSVSTVTITPRYHPASGTSAATLRVTDSGGRTASDTVVITVN